jgi:hypothetical protein
MRWCWLTSVTQRDFSVRRVRCLPRTLVFRACEISACTSAGKTGRGTPEYRQCNPPRVDIINSTLGKALGGATGGYTTGPKQVVDVLRYERSARCERYREKAGASWCMFGVRGEGQAAIASVSLLEHVGAGGGRRLDQVLRYELSALRALCDGALSLELFP